MLQKKREFFKIDLEVLWNQVPPDYYDSGIKANIFQKIWHTKKLITLKALINNTQFEKVLDVGCAGGALTNNIFRLFPESKITAVDVYKNAIKYGRKEYPKINFILADAHQLPFERNSFDLVICCETIEHLVNPLQALKEIKRVLKQSGTAIVSMDSGSTLFKIVWWFWERTKGRVWQGAHLHPFHHSQLEKIIRKAGFKIKGKRFSHLGMEVSFVLRK